MTPNNDIDPYKKIRIRPHAGFGSSDGNDFNYYGLRILLPADDTKSYGLELSRFDIDTDQFNAIGIILEKRIHEWLNLSIGTIGYFNYGENSDHVIGLSTGMAWEPKNQTPFRPFISFRNDTVFNSNDTDSFQSISIGFGF
jgi:hypothetical protein